MRGSASPDMPAPPSKSAFPHAFRSLRKARGLTQEDFEPIASRVYISILERGEKQPTLPMIEGLAEILGVLAPTEN